MQGCGSREPIVFRDERGRFTKMDAMMIIDEAGNPGRIHLPGEKFVMTATVTDDPHGFGEISNRHKKAQARSGRIGKFSLEKYRRTGELKAKDDTLEGVTQVIDEISRSGAEVYVMEINKDKPPEWWRTDKRRHGLSRDNGNETLSKTLDEVIPKTKGKRIGVVVDQSNNYTSVSKTVSGKSSSRKQIIGDSYDSDNGPYSDQLQTNDYVPYAVELRRRGISKKLTRRLKARFRRL